MDIRTIILFFAVNFLFVHYVTSTLTNVSDQSALLTLKSHISFGFNNVFLDKNWSASSPVCSWMGVHCSARHNRVIALNISDMSLSGTIPPQLGNLSFLVYLDISNNSFSGNLPDELARLQRLKFLDLRSNNFSGLIPSFLSSLPKLQLLYLSQNRFSGSIPSSLSNISKLEVLSLGSNFLEGTIPGEIGHLHYLTILYLHLNRLSGPIPTGIFNLSSLQYFGLTGNHLSGNLPADICSNLPFLKGLYFSQNEFDGLISQNLGKCSQLQDLSLSINQFSGIIPREIGNLTQLKHLYLGDNNFRGSMPTEIANLQRLEVLGMNGNSLSGSIPESIFNISTLQVFSCVGSLLSGNLPSNMGQWLPNLKEIYLGINNFSGNIPDSISNASKLTILDLSKNSYTGPIPTSLGNLASLQVLNLGSNNLMNEPISSELRFITSLTNCRNLKELVIGENPLGGVLPSSVGNLSTSLEYFAAYKCKIRGNIPEDIGNLSTLAGLSLFENDLSGYIPRTIEDLQGLQELYLDSNNIRGSFPSNICNLPQLAAISLSWNQFSGPVSSCIGNITSLRNLNLDSNNFSSSLPPSLWSLKDLLLLNASSNSLSGNLPPEIGNLKAVIMIDLSKNSFSGNIPSSLVGLQNLINFSLAQNELEGSIPDSFGKLLSLEVLDLSHNKLTGVIPQTLEALTYLKQFNVSFNQLSGQIPSGGPFINFTGSSFMSNGALCGAPQFQALPCSKESKSKKKKRSRLTIYIVVGISSSVLALVLGFALVRWQKEKKATLETVQSPARTFERISYHELAKITNGFSESNLIGTGSYSLVYKGTLNDGTVLAIKVLNLKLAGALQTFATECEVLSSLRHRNLTKVITSCSNLDRDFLALILEYMPNGSLEKWLHSSNYFLNILQRLNIMIDVASALDYLHNGYSSPVVHCDVKPSNILLDKDMVGHVCDFGLAKLFGAGVGTVQTKTLATIGYIAPEYGLEGIVSTKCDVYSFGITLMETFTGRRPTDDMFSGGITLRDWIQDSFPSAIMQVVDCNLLIVQEDYKSFDAMKECVSSVMMLALNCTETSPDSRMNMHDVVSALKNLRSQFVLLNCNRSTSSNIINTAASS